jgi:MATE family multidrug resistance protein
MIPLALGVATTARVGHAVGRGDPLGVRAAGTVGILASLLVMGVTALLFLLAPKVIVSAYLDVSRPENAAVIANAVAFLGVAAAFQLFDGLQVSALGALRGLKDTRGPMLITLVSYWFVGLGSGVALAFGFGLEGVGLWWGLVIGLAVAAVALTLRFRSLLRRLSPPASSGLNSRS